MNVSSGFYQFLVHIFARKALTLVLTLIKNDPKHPLITPKIIAPGITSVGTILATLTVPNLTVEVDQVSNLPCNKPSKKAIVKTAVAQHRNVFHSIENFQYGLGLVSS